MRTKNTYKIEKIKTNKLCSYGCGNIARYEVNKNKRYCCSRSEQSCSAVKKKNGDGNRGKKQKSPTKPIKIETKELCYYGCGEIAQYYFIRAKKYCCSENYNQCPTRKEKLSNFRKSKPYMTIKLIDNLEKKLCEFDCGRIAKYQINNNGKLCCSKSINSCPIIKKKKSKSITEYYEINKHPMKNKTYLEMYGEEKTKKIIEKKNVSSKSKNVRFKRGWYKGYWNDSSWELAWVIDKLEHNIEFERNHEAFPYIFKGEKHNWIPDFKIKRTYYEIKGRITDKDKAKFASFEKPLKVIGPKEIQKSLDYVINKYGKDFTRLYE